MDSAHKIRVPSDLRRLVCAGLLLAIGLVLPTLFHMAGGAAAGKTLLPLHLPVLMAGLLLGPVWGAAIGVVLPSMSFLFTAMPAPPMLFFMWFELAAYGGLAGLFIKKLPLYPSLALALIGGRLVNALALLAGVGVLGVSYPGMSGALLPAVAATVAGATATGLPGILLQLVVLPPLVYAVKRSGVLYGRT